MDNNKNDNRNGYFVVSFRVMGDLLDPADVTRLLGIDPSREHKKGDENLVVTKKGKTMRFASYKSGLWALESSQDKYSDLEDHLQGFLQLLEPKVIELLKLKYLGFELDFYVSYVFANADQPGICINSDVMKRIGDLGINLGIDLYA